MNRLRIGLLFLLLIITAVAASARDLIWVRATSLGWELADQDGKFVTLWSDVEQSSMAVEIKPKKKQYERVYLVVGTLKGKDVWKAEILGRLMRE
jgi:hypothetical protein